MRMLKRQLKKMRLHACPTRQFKKRLWVELCAEMEDGVPIRRHSFVWRYGAVALAVVMIVFTSGTAVYAYESPSVATGHPLYFMKNAAEKIQGGFAWNEDRKVQYHARMMDRRLKEAEHYLQQAEYLAPSFEQATMEFAETISTLDSCPCQHGLREQVIARVEEQSMRYQTILLHVSQNGETAEVVQIQVPDEFVQQVRQVQYHLDNSGFSQEEASRLFPERVGKVMIKMEMAVPAH